MKIFGIDLDGSVTKAGFYNPSVRLPWWLFFVLLPLVLLQKPRRTIVEKLRVLQEKGCKIIIVTARPAQLAALTKFQLLFHNVPFDAVFCVGFGKGTKKRKLEVIKREGIEMFVDDNEKCLRFLRKHSVNAVPSLNYLAI